MRAGPFLTSVADRTWPQGGVRRVSTQFHEILFPLLGRGCVYERTGGCS